MKKRKNPNKIEGVTIQNPVAKFAHQFNKAHVFADKNTYRRNAKHWKQEDSPIALVRVIREAACVLETVIRKWELIIRNIEDQPNESGNLTLLLSPMRNTEGTTN